MTRDILKQKSSVLVKVRTISKDSNMKNYTHRSCKPLDEVNFNPDDNQLDMFNNECEGMCGV